ncbi:HpcH/HpaI aldolase/citrate lyase family protein [Geodermatophilus sp. SYSU D01105]
MTRPDREAALRRRTQLFVPANKPAFLPKAAASGADAVILDLEDSVPAGARADARAGLADAVRSLPGGHVLVRVNSDADLARDVEAAVTAGASGVLVPKAEDPVRVRLVDALVTAAERACGRAEGSVEVQLLVETPRGLLRIDEVAGASARTTALMPGTEDLAAELEVDPSDEQFDLRWAHGLVVCAARAHGLAPYGLMRSLANFRDLPALARDARAARSFGYVGALCVHPAQVPVLTEAFSPAPEEVAHAQRVLDALAEGERAGTAAVSVDGRMVDTPMATRARRLLARAGRGQVSEQGS